MKTAPTFLQTLALTALLAAQMHGALSMPGIRQALRIIAGQPAPIFCQSGIHASTDAAAAGRTVSIAPCP